MPLGCSAACSPAGGFTTQPQSRSSSTTLWAILSCFHSNTAEQSCMAQAWWCFCSLLILPGISGANYLNHQRVPDLDAANCIHHKFIIRNNKTKQIKPYSDRYVFFFCQPDGSSRIQLEPLRSHYSLKNGTCGLLVLICLMPTFLMKH